MYLYTVESVEEIGWRVATKLKCGLRFGGKNNFVIGYVINNNVFPRLSHKNCYF